MESGPAMKRQHGRQVRAGVQGRVVRRAVAPERPAATSSSVPASPAQADQIVAEGMAHHRAGRFAEAEACCRLDLAIQRYRQAIALQPESPQAYNNLGVALQAQGALVEAIPCFERAIALAPGYPDGHFNLG